MTVRTGVYSFGDFLELIHEDQKADLIDGVIYMASPESLEHNDLVLWLGTLMRLYVEGRDCGRVTVNKVAYRLTPMNAPEPDLAFVRKDRLHILKKGYVDGPPDLAVEVVSPESVERDYQLKRSRYESAGVAEYWIIDSDERKAFFLANGANGFTEASVRDHLYESTVLPGFKLDVRWLWQRPLPPALAIVQAMLQP